MGIAFNHTIVQSRDRRESAEFLSELFGLAAPTPYGPFLVVELDHGASLDYVQAPPGAEITEQHYAFLVSDEDFDAIYGRIQERKIDHWADPFHNHPGEINHNDGGRGVYFPDPSGHNLEIITVPYGGN